MLPTWLACIVLYFFTCAAALHDEQLVISTASARIQPVNVAIIGAGPAGASAAYHLAKFGASSRTTFNVTVFERNSYVGGRSTTVNAYDHPSLPVELGASIFVQVNKILVDAVKEFNLSTAGLKTPKSTIPGPALAVWNGQQFVFVQNGERRWWDIAKMLWKYGFAPMRTVNLMKSTVGKFLQMYDEPVFPFQSLTQAVEDVGLLPVTAATGEQYMTENGITGAFGNDIVQASTRVNYAQNLKYIHGLEAMVCMATEGAMSVDGGNWKIFDNMVTASRARKHLKTEVTGIEKQIDGAYTLAFSGVDDSSPDSTDYQSFDSVILTAPYQFANISFLATPRHIPDRVPYVRLHVTLFTSPHLLSPTFFNLKPLDSVPKVILTTIPRDEQPRQGAEGCGSPGFFSISLLDPVINPTNGQQEYIYKIFSPEPVETGFLAQLLGIHTDEETDGLNGPTISNKDVSWIYRKVWNSYPYEYPRVTFEEIGLDEGFLYTSGMESFISTMETSALAGMNSARLIVDHWEKRRKNDSMRGMREPDMLT